MQVPVDLMPVCTWRYASVAIELEVEKEFHILVMPYPSNLYCSTGLPVVWIAGRGSCEVKPKFLAWQILAPIDLQFGVNDETRLR
ncbi:hypothetical protein RvVAT039_pl03190 (plasmid) [Agrobacterium vitis]|uniref:hypothetical protein n=1 Tax=Agrobacterium vitis TaxID=373 RepID=UPI0015DAE587|nr:hypothetical protein [Agrobacterium vitis]BCH67486.1 hypothetical protein RvVAT039_pl03190 [Agrobacterium vitis]